MFSTIKEFFYEITKQKIPLGIIFVLLIIDFSVSKEQIERLLKIFFSEATINELENFISIAFYVAFCATAIAGTICILSFILEVLIEKIRKNSDLSILEKFFITLKIKFEHYVTISSSFYVVLYITQHILEINSLSSDSLKSFCEIFILLFTILTWILTFTNEIKHEITIS